MADLISRTAAIEALGERPYNWTDSDSEIAEVCAWESHKSAIENVPAVDAVPVVHARWIVVHGYCTPGGDPVWACSKCGKGLHVFGIEHSTYGSDIADGQWVACPNCGAKMDGERMEDE